MIPLSKEQRKHLKARAPQDPIWWLGKSLGVKFWSIQEDIVESVRDNPRTSARSCHAIGKSYLAGNIAIWFLYSFPYSIVLTTAPTFRQVEKLIWKEIRSSLRKAKINLGGELAKKSPELQIVQDEWVALGLSTNQPDRFQGFHAKHILVIVDEAPGINEDIFEAIEGVLTSEHCRLLLTGNPTNIGGTFYRSHREQGWKTFHISAFDTPNFTYFGITEEDFENNTWQAKITGPLPAPWLITPQWAYDKYVRWGKNHPAYQARVLGEFPEQGEYNVIPLSWIERAQELWHEAKPDPTEKIVLGVDVARGGLDSSAIVARQGNKILSVETFRNLDGPKLAGEVIIRYRKLNASLVNIDIIGLGASPYDELKKFPDIVVNPVNVSIPSDKLDERGFKKYGNLRAELWWTLRESLSLGNPNPLSIPPDEDLLGDLAAPKYDFSKGWIQIEKKEDTKSRLGRSPDKGDAAMLTFASLPPVKKKRSFTGQAPVIGGAF